MCLENNSNTRNSNTCSSGVLVMPRGLFDHQILEGFFFKGKTLVHFCYLKCCTYLSTSHEVQSILCYKIFSRIDLCRVLTCNVQYAFLQRFFVPFISCNLPHQYFIMHPIRFYCHSRKSHHQLYVHNFLFWTASYKEVNPILWARHVKQCFIFTVSSNKYR